jgi:hypothetical protein
MGVLGVSGLRGARAGFGITATLEALAALNAQMVVDLRKLPA